MDFNPNDINDLKVVKIRIDAVGGDLDRVADRYPKSFMDEMARQLTAAIEAATGVSGIADSSVELVMMFASGTFMEHVSLNVTYRRLMLLDKVSAPRDFWVKWTKLAVIDGEYNEGNILFELGEDVEQKIREREYKYLISSQNEKYHNAMGRKKVTEWREVIKRAAKRGELVRLETDFELAPETRELEDRIAHLLGKRIADRAMPEKEEIPYIHSDEADYERAMEKVRLIVSSSEENESADERLSAVELIPTFEAEEVENSAEPTEPIDKIDDLSGESEDDDIFSEDPGLDPSDTESEREDYDEGIFDDDDEADASQTSDADLMQSNSEISIFDLAGEFNSASDSEYCSDAIDHESENSDELFVDEASDIPKMQLSEPEPTDPEEEDIEQEEEIEKLEAAEEIVALEEKMASYQNEDETESFSDEEAASDFCEACTDTYSPPVEPKAEEEKTYEIDENKDRMPENLINKDEIGDKKLESDQPAAPTPKTITTPIADRVADIRAELETKIRLEYESRARMKAEEELISLRHERERLKIERDAILAEAMKEQERLRLEYERLMEQTRREAEQREFLEAQRRAEEEQLRAQIERQLRAEAMERERLAESARMAIEEQHRLEAENARMARIREEEERAEAERLRRIEEEKALEELRRAELERIRREDEEAKERARNAMPEMGDGRYSYTSKSVKLLFRRSVDPNITTRIYEIIKATVDYYGKDRVYLKIRASVPDSQTVVLDFEHVPIEEMELLGNIIKILGNSGLGIAKAIIE